MSDLVVITRPDVEARDYAIELGADGYETYIEPMLNIRSRDFTAPDLSQFDGVLITSANAVEHYVRGGGDVFDIPVYCVGKHSATAARDAGFVHVASMSGTGVDLLNHVLSMADVAQKRFLHICGVHVAFPLMDRLLEVSALSQSLVVYESVKTRSFSDGFLKVLQSGDIAAVTFFSKRTAEAFVGAVRESDSESYLKGIKALSISEAVVECVRVLPWGAIHCSKTPDRAGMMALLKAYV